MMNWLDWLAVVGFIVTCLGALSTLAFFVNRIAYRPRLLISLAVNPSLFHRPSLDVRVEAVKHPVHIDAAWISYDPGEIALSLMDGPDAAQQAPIAPDFSGVRAGKFEHSVIIPELMESTFSPSAGGYGVMRLLLPKKTNGEVRVTVSMRIPDGYIRTPWDMFPSRIVRRRVVLQYDSERITTAGDPMKTLKRISRSPIKPLALVDILESVLLIGASFLIAFRIHRWIGCALLAAGLARLVQKAFILNERG